MTDDVTVIRSRAAAVLDAGETLRAANRAERALWLVEAAQTLSRQVESMGAQLSGATGLSVSMVHWASRTTLDTVQEDHLLALGREAHSECEQALEPIAMLSVVLAGNVFTASVRAIVVPLLLGVPVLVKASSRETIFPAMLRDALRRADSSLGAAVDLVAFPGGDTEREAALVERAEAVSVYGSNETVAAMAARLGTDALICHGHGVSVAYCGARALDEARLGDTIAGLSLDLCAYDQRGCLSPQLLYVERADGTTVLNFARRLAADGLDPMSATLPRGPLPSSVGAEQAQWRGIAEVEGTLIRGASYGLAIRGSKSVRWSPGYRNMTIVPVSGIDEALGAMEQIGSSLKCVGADPASISEVRAGLRQSQTLSAYACPLGTMQTPALDAPADGLPIWHGLLRSEGRRKPG